MSKFNSKFILKNYYKIIFTGVIFVIYTITLAPSVQQIDSGELAAVQCTLGIAHPTGYPLFTLLGYLFQLLPLPISAILKLNLLSAIWSSAGVYFFLSSIELIYEKVYIQKTGKSAAGIKSKGREKQSTESDIVKTEYLKILSVTGSGFILAFSKSYWLQSTGTEVYSLHMALISIIVYFLLKTFFNTGPAAARSTENWIIVAMLLAFGFSNHMTTLLILPAAALLFFYKEKFNARSLLTFAVSSIVFIAVLLLCYSYLPFRASMNPPINWGNPVDTESIIRHVSGQQYQVWLFSSIDAAKKQFIYFFENLPDEFMILIFVFILIGAVELFKNSKIIFLFTAICFLTTLLYSINYDINDIDSYFLLAYYSLAMLSAFGIIRSYYFLRRIKLGTTISLSLLGLVILFQGILNASKADQSDVYIFEDYTKNILNSVAENSIVFSYQWDYFLSASYYFQFVEKYRDDVIVIDKELLRRSWYFNQLKTNNRELFAGFESDVQNFLKAVDPFEKGKKFNPELLEKYFRSIQTNLIAYNIDEHDYYIGPELVDNEIRKGQFILPDGYNIVPHLFLFKVVSGNEYVPAPDPDFKLRIPKNKNGYTQFIEKITAQMLSYRAMYELSYNKTERAKLYIQKISDDFPDYKLAAELKNILKK